MDCRYELLYSGELWNRISNLLALQFSVYLCMYTMYCVNLSLEQMSWNLLIYKSRRSDRSSIGATILHHAFFFRYRFPSILLCYLVGRHCRNSGDGIRADGLFPLIGRTN